MVPHAPEPEALSVSLELDPLSIQSTFNRDRGSYVIIRASAVSRMRNSGIFQH